MKNKVISDRINKEILISFVCTSHPGFMIWENPDDIFLKLLGFAP